MASGMAKQNIAVLEYLQKHGTITSLEAFERLKITRLSARIYDLRRLGYTIEDCYKTRRTEDGTAKRWAEYRLVMEAKDGECA